MKVVFAIFFLTFSKVKVDFTKREFIWKAYTTAEALSTTKKVQIINLKKFAKVVLDPKQKTFVVYIAIFFVELIKVHSDHKVQIGALITNKALIIILAKYLDFADIFLKKSTTVLPKHTEINTYALINLEKDKQPLYGPIYSLELVELKTLKIYIETKLANGFIRPFKSSVSTLILFDKKLDESFWLYVNYQNLNNMIIKNQYPFPLVSKFFYCLGHAKKFTQLDLISAYYQIRMKKADK